VEEPALAEPLIQAQLLSEAVISASVGFLVWDERRRYIAANDAACEILGTTLANLLGAEVGGHTTTQDVEGLLDEALRSTFASGTAEVDRFDGSGAVKVFYATFTTNSAGMPFMATLLTRLPD
jgi:PAS domain-containing protein